MLDRLDKQMHEASDALEFERAARLRDQLVSVRKAIERQQMVAAKEEDFDVIGLAEDPLEASVQVFFVRRGRVVGRRGFVVDKVEDVDGPALVAKLLEQLYGDAAARGRPARGARPGASPTTSRALRGVPHRGPGGWTPTRRSQGKVRIRVPQRGAEARAARDGDPQRGRGVRPAQAAPGVRPQRAGPRAHRAAGGARPPRGTVADRVLRHLEPAGHRDRRRRWW